MEKTGKRAKKSFFVLLTAILTISFCGAATGVEIDEAVDEISCLEAEQDLPTGCTITSGEINGDSSSSCPAWVTVIDRYGVDGGHLTVKLDSCTVFTYTLYYSRQNGGTGYIAYLERGDVFIEWDEDAGHGSLGAFSFSGNYVERTPSYVQVSGWYGTNWTVYEVISSGELIKTGDCCNEHEAIHISFIDKIDDVNVNECVEPGDEINYTINYTYPMFTNFNFWSLTSLVEWWLADDCAFNDNCDETDLDVDGTVNFVDFALFADNWLKKGIVLDVNIIDYLPDEVDFNSVSDGGVYDSNTHTVKWSVGTIVSGESVCVTLKVNVNEYVEPCPVIENRCEARSGTQVLERGYEFTPTCGAFYMSPANGANEVPVDAVLKWVDDILSEERDVYFGTSFSDVNDANRSNPLGVLVSEGQGPNTFDPYDVNGFLALDRTYYWRVDEVNSSLNPIWQGDVWSFTTSNHFVLDDFESYSTNDDLRDVWYDYYGYGNDTAAEVYLAKSSDGDPTLDERSMEYQFNNHYSPYYSEAWVILDELGIDNSFIRMDVRSLSIWFYGQANNPVSEKMYVKLIDGAGESAKVLYNTLNDMNDIRIKTWQEWDVSIRDFLDNNDVNLADIDRITIGFDEGDRIDGKVYFDDIRLCTAR